MTLWELPAGASTGMHEHRFDYLVLPMSDGELTATSNDGVRHVSAVTSNVPYFRHAGVTHEVVCSSPTTVRFVEIELLEGAGPAADPNPDFGGVDDGA